MNIIAKNAMLAALDVLAQASRKITEAKNAKLLAFAKGIRHAQLRRV